MKMYTSRFAGAGLERLRFFSRQLITADDMCAEQEYFRQKLRRHNRFLHGWGVVCGCLVMPKPDASHLWQVCISPGYVITPQGDEVLVSDAVNFDLGGDSQSGPDPCSVPAPCPPVGYQPPPSSKAPVYLAVRYRECNTRPVRVTPSGCGCDEANCEYSRIRDDFDIVRLSQLPKCYAQKAKAEAVDKTQLLVPTKAGYPTLPALPGCPECCDDPHVVLAEVTVPASRQSAIAASNIAYTSRRTLYSMSAVFPGNLP
jgi:hypothetical protein